MKQTELLETITELLEREHTRARADAYAASIFWEHELRGSDLTRHAYIQLKQDSLRRAMAILDGWKKLQAQLSGGQPVTERCFACEHVHKVGERCNTDVIIGGHSDNPHCGPGETETTACACVGLVQREDRCLCGGAGCNSCEPQGRG